MTGVVHVRHPVPVRHVPLRGCRERLSLRQETTPVRLRSEPAAAFREAFRVAHGGRIRHVSYHEHGGRLWSPLFDEQADGVRFWGPDALRDWLAADGLALGCPPDLIRTPLVAIAPTSLEYPLKLSRGAGAADLPLGRVVDDLSGACAANLRRFLEEEVVLAGDRVFVRACSPMACYGLQVMRTPTQQWTGIPGCRVDRVERYRVVPWSGGMEPDPRLPELLSKLDPALLENDDLRFFANITPQVVGRIARGVLKHEPKDGTGAHRALLDQAEALRPWIARGLVGGVAPADYGHVAELVRDFVQGLRAGYQAMGSRLMRIHADYVEGYVLPTILESVRPDAGDEQAFAALGGP